MNNVHALNWGSTRMAGFLYARMHARMMMMMMNCFCGMANRQKTFSLISNQDHCQRSSPLRISNMPQAGFEP